MTTEALVNDDSAERTRTLHQYSSLDAARADQQRFESQSLVGEFYSSLGQYGLHFARSRSDVQDLLRHGAPIDGVKKIDYGDDLQHWETPLLTAFVDQRLEVATALIDHGAHIDAPNMIVYATGGGFGHTALHMLVVRGESAGAKSLIAAGADVNRQTTIGTTPMHFAAEDADDEMVVTLRRAGASRYIRDFGGNLPIDMATPENRPLLS